MCQIYMIFQDNENGYFLCIYPWHYLGLIKLCSSKGNIWLEVLHIDAVNDDLISE